MELQLLERLRSVAVDARLRDRGVKRAQVRDQSAPNRSKLIGEAITRKREQPSEAIDSVGTDKIGQRGSQKYREDGKEQVSI